MVELKEKEYYHSFYNQSCFLLFVREESDSGLICGEGKVWYETEDDHVKEEKRNKKMKKEAKTPRDNLREKAWDEKFKRLMVNKCTAFSEKPHRHNKASKL